jgi:hypothetical protein
MSHRCRSIFLFSLAVAAGASTVPAQRTAVEVQIYDYADLKPGAVHKIVAGTQQILAGAGLTVEVKLCRGALAVSCESETGSVRRLVVRVVAEGAKTVRASTLGHSFAGQEGGTYASVFLDRVQEAAAEANVPWDIVAAYAAVHEVGHLLLGAEAHTLGGLMKGSWDRKDYQAMNQNCFHFSDEQAHQLADRYGGRSPVDIRLEPAF